MRALLALFALAALNPGCTCTEIAPEAKPAITAAWSDDFNRPSLGPDWLATDAEAYKIVNGELVVARGYNHPLWLTRPIPRDAVIEFDCWSNDDAGDLKVEVWGDGKSFATGDKTAAYTSTAYNFIFGGWRNTTSTLARMHEHGGDRHTRSEPRVVKGQKYHWRIERTGGQGKVDWQVDGAPFLSFEDAQPLEGENHRFFAINNWEAELHFDNLKITPR
ncbi:MAG: hypothetical protein EXR72_00780 [Myxococcales bacterium]|nr:hypothetical protein [Myxococcales bacterium]